MTLPRSLSTFSSLLQTVLSQHGQYSMHRTFISCVNITLAQNETWTESELAPYFIRACAARRMIAIDYLIEFKVKVVIAKENCWNLISCRRFNY